MAAFLVTYELGSGGQDADLKRALMAFRIHVQIQPSVWIIETGEDAVTLATALERCLKDDAKLLVVEVARDAAGCGHPPTVVRWLRTVL